MRSLQAKLATANDAQVCGALSAFAQRFRPSEPFNCLSPLRRFQARATTETDQLRSECLSLRADQLELQHVKESLQRREEEVGELKARLRRGEEEVSGLKAQVERLGRQGDSALEEAREEAREAHAQLEEEMLRGARNRPASGRDSTRQISRRAAPITSQLTPLSPAPFPFLPPPPPFLWAHS